MIVFNANAQNNLQRTPKGASYQIFTQSPGEKLKLNDVVTFQFIQKNYKDSVLFSTYAAGHPVQVQIVPSKGVADLMEIFPLLAVKDSVLIKVPVDSIFAGHEDQRPPFLPKGTAIAFILKIERAQTLDEAIAERNAAVDKIKAAEKADAAKYIADHKLLVKTTPSGLKYVITKPSAKLKPLKGDTLLVNYAGRTTDGKLFDSSIESVAKSGGLQQPGRTYEPLQVIVGTTSIIQGWDEGLLLLNEGSKAKFIIPSSLGYGEHGNGDAIPPYSTLVFDIELVKVKPIKHPATTKPAVKKTVHKTSAVVKKKTAVTKN
ncbi:MAG: fkpA 1 [Mucilaginibacter sp.]|nr:fkpA 1 [Mucilaginibacter sp.]